MILMKVRSALGTPMVFDVQPQHVGTLDRVFDYGRHLYSKFDGKWVDVTRPGRPAVSEEKAATLDGMSFDFESNKEAA